MGISVEFPLAGGCKGSAKWFFSNIREQNVWYFFTNLRDKSIQSSRTQRVAHANFSSRSLAYSVQWSSFSIIPPVIDGMRVQFERTTTQSFGTRFPPKTRRSRLTNQQTGTRCVQPRLCTVFIHSSGEMVGPTLRFDIIFAENKTSADKLATKWNVVYSNLKMSESTGRDLLTLPRDQFSIVNLWGSTTHAVRVKLKSSICLLYKSADTAFWLCRVRHFIIIKLITELVSNHKTSV